MLSDKFATRKDLSNPIRPKTVEQDIARQRMFQRMQQEINDLQPAITQKKKKQSPPKNNQTSLKTESHSPPHSAQHSPTTTSPIANKQSFFVGNRNAAAAPDKKSSLPEILSL